MECNVQNSKKTDLQFSNLSSCLPLKQCLWIHTGHIHTAFHSQWSSLPLPTESTLRKSQWRRATAQVITWINGTTVWLMVYPSHRSSDSSGRTAPLGLGVRGPHTHSIMACGLPHSRTRGESWKEPETYLPLVLLIAKPSQAPTLAKATKLGLRTIAAPLVGNQRSNDTDSRVFPALPFQHKGRQDLNGSSRALSVPLPKQYTLTV